MEMKELLGWIDKEDKILRARYASENEDKRTYTRTIKLVEEIGELCNEILAHDNQQREDKIQGSLSHEFADVIITTFLLANHLNVDIEEALEEKIKKIDIRNQKAKP